MTDAEIAATTSAISTILGAAATLAPEVYQDIRAALAGHHPDLLPPPPPRADAAIEAEDAARIAAKFPEASER